MDIKVRAVQGAFWNVAFALGNKVVTFGGQLALAWFLLPSDMGLANMAQSMAAFTAVLSAGGLSDVLIQRRRYEEEAGQAFWLSFGLYSLMALALCGMALISPVLGRPEVRNLLFVLASVNLVGFPCTVLAAGLKSRLDFKGLAFSNFLGGLTYTSMAILLAWFGWGSLSLIAPIVLKYLVTLIFMLTRNNRIHLAWPVWSKIRVLLKPTMALSFSGFFTGLQTQAPVFVCGLVLTTADTGFFSWGWSVAGQTVFLLAISLRDVLLPVFTRLENNVERRAKAALKSAHIMTALLCVACGAQALLAEAMIKLFIPGKWYPAIPVVEVASLGLVLQGLWISGMAWLNACGKYRLLLKISALQAFLAATFTWIGVILGGTMGGALGCTLANLLGAMACVLPMGKQLLLKQAWLWTRPLGLSSMVWILCHIFSSGHGPARQVSAAIVFILFAGWIWWREDEGGLRVLMKKLPESFLAYKPAVSVVK